MKPKFIIFASGTKTGGGSGFENLVIASRDGRLNANIVAVISNHESGGVRQIADKLHVPFCHFPASWTKERYQAIVDQFSADFVALSGWLKLVSGLDPKTTFNIHPGPLPCFGGPSMYGRHVHEAVLDCYKRELIQYSAVSMHFVTEEYDEGPVFFSFPVKIIASDTAQTLGERVHDTELFFQPFISNLVVEGKIYWDGEDNESLCVPSNYQYLPKLQ